MQNDPTPQPQPSPADFIGATGIIGETMAELVALAESLPFTAENAPGAAKILDRLSEDLAEAAGQIRSAAARERRFMP